jgi:hypothetical protein
MFNGYSKVECQETQQFTQTLVELIDLMDGAAMLPLIAKYQSIISKNAYKGTHGRTPYKNVRAIQATDINNPNNFTNIIYGNLFEEVPMQRWSSIGDIAIE